MKSTRLQRSTNRTSSDMIWNLNLRAVTAGLYRKLFDWCWSARYKVRSFSCQLYIGTCSQLKFFLVTFQTLQTLTKNGLVASFSFKTARKKDGEGVVEKLRLLRAVALSTSPFPSLSASFEALLLRRINAAVDSVNGKTWHKILSRSLKQDK